MTQDNQITINGAVYEINRVYVGSKTIKEILAEKIASSCETIAFDKKVEKAL